MSEKILEIKSEDERRQHQRRAEDRARQKEGAANRELTIIMRDVRSIDKADMLARERRYALLSAAAVIYAEHWTASMDANMETGRGTAPVLTATVATAEALLATIERREIERREGQDNA